MNGSSTDDRGDGVGHDRLARIETAPHGVITVDESGRITGVDPFAQALFGLAAEDVVGRPVSDLLPGAPEALEGAAAGDAPAIRHLEGLCADGTTIGLEVALARNGSPGQFLVALRERTAATPREEHARRAAVMRLLGRFSSRICHDLKNHLMAVSGYSELAAGRIETDPQKARQMLDQVLEAADRALAYVEGIHALGRGKPDGVRTVEIEPLLRELEPRLRAALPAEVALHVDTSEARGAADAVAESLERGIWTLVENAADALGAGGRIDVRLGVAEIEPHAALPDLAPGVYATIEVEDDGPGMDAATRMQLFEPFIRKPKERGRGIGLATVYAMCRQLGGGVTVRSAPGKGTTIRVHLPYRDSPSAAWEGRGLESASPPGPDGMTILVVDDVPSVRNIAKEALQDFGYRVLVAESGHVALELASNHPERIDLLLTDVLMPGMNGRELAVAFEEQHPRVPILFMSAYARDPLPLGPSGEAVPFIAKPFTPRDLAQKVRTVLSGAA